MLLPLVLIFIQVFVVSGRYFQPLTTEYVSLLKTSKNISYSSYLQDPNEYLMSYENRKIYLLDDIEGGRAGELMGHIFFNHTESKIFVGFKGTVPSSIADWMSNAWSLKANLGDPQNLLVHAGFGALAKSCYQSLQKELLTIFWKNPRDVLNYEFIFAGHSRGGALALLSAILLNGDELFAFRNETNDFEKMQYFNRGNNIKVISFNSPRVLSTAAAEKFPLKRENHIRISNYFDLVSRVPPSSMGFKHTGVFIRSSLTEEMIYSNFGAFALASLPLLVMSISIMTTFHSLEGQEIEECGYHF